MLTDYRELLDELLFELVVIGTKDTKSMRMYKKLREWSESDEREDYSE